MASRLSAQLRPHRRISCRRLEFRRTADWAPKMETACSFEELDNNRYETLSEVFLQLRLGAKSAFRFLLIRISDTNFLFIAVQYYI